MSATQQVMTAGNNACRLALGTVQFGVPYGVANTSGQVPSEMARAMVQFAIASGIDTLDTAIGYGESEQVLGKVGMDGLSIVSKLLPLPASVNDAHSWVLSEAEASLARLRVGTLHGMLLHRSSDLVGPQGAALYAAMRELQEAGKVRKIGLSIYAPAELDVYEDMYTFDLIQAPINLVDRRLASSGWLRRLKERGCEGSRFLLQGRCYAVAQFLQVCTVERVMGPMARVARVPQYGRGSRLPFLSTILPRN